MGLLIFVSILVVISKISYDYNNRILKTFLAEAEIKI